MSDSTGNRIAIAGARGLVGRPLFWLLRQRGFRLSVLSRDPVAARATLPGAAEYLSFRPSVEEGRWAAAIDGAHAVLMLAGASRFARRFGPKAQREIRESRFIANRGLVTAMADARVAPRVFVSASSVGYYGFPSGPRAEEAVDERHPGARDELSHDYRQLESAARAAEGLGVRTVVVRTGLVLSTEGALPEIATRVRRFLGGVILPGSQPLPWIHLQDEIGLWLLALEDPRVRGPLNATAPEVPTNREFMEALAGRL
ncbi:MAG: NAD-dependent epimerase/dehydratase family protein, partial [Deltaproteobacteria bacterium]